MSDHPPLVLRPWSESDAVALREAIDEDVDHLKPWLSWTLEEPASLERTRVRLRKWVEAFQTGQGYRWAITPEGDPGRILGGANLNNRVGPDAHDLGYWIRKSAARRGITSAAVAALVVHAFESRGVDRLVSRCDVANSASVRFARGLGFRSIAGATTTYPDGRPRPVVQLEMTREAYEGEHGEALKERARGVRVVAAEMEGA